MGQVGDPQWPYHNRNQSLDLSIGATETDLLDYVSQWAQAQKIVYRPLASYTLFVDTLNMNYPKIARLPRSSEKRVISFSLFGNDSRYIEGAFQNLELLDTYFPGGFVCM